MKAFPTDFAVVGTQSEQAQAYMNGVAYIASNTSNLFLKYDAFTDKITKLADKPSSMGFHKAILLERRHKPFIYMVGGYNAKYGYWNTEKYHVTKNVWKKMKAKTCPPAGWYLQAGETLVELSLYYFIKKDMLYAFGGKKLETSHKSAKPLGMEKKYDKTFAVQRLKLKKSDDIESWEVLYYKAPLPLTHLYINNISEDDFIIFGDTSSILVPDWKSVGFYYTKFEDLRDFENDIIYLEEYGLEDVYDQKSAITPITTFG